jgi:hypothetical protein
MPGTGKWKTASSSIADTTGLSTEEQARIRKAGQGEGLLVTAGRRVWVSLYGHTSPGEFVAFHTDHEEADDDEDTEERPC